MMDTIALPFHAGWLAGCIALDVLTVALREREGVQVSQLSSGCEKTKDVGGMNFSLMIEGDEWKWQWILVLDVGDVIGG